MYLRIAQLFLFRQMCPPGLCRISALNLHTKLTTILKIPKKVPAFFPEINLFTGFTHGNNFTFADCDGIDEKAYAQLARTKSKYSCVLCRGEKQERMDSFHRKNRNKTT